MQHAQQCSFRTISRGLYENADRLARRARFSTRRREELFTVRQFFRQESPWFRAVEAACKIHGVAFGPSLKAQHNKERQYEP